MRAPEQCRHQRAEIKKYVLWGKIVNIIQRGKSGLCHVHLCTQGWRKGALTLSPPIQSSVWRATIHSSGMGGLLVSPTRRHQKEGHSLRRLREGPGDGTQRWLAGWPLPFTERVPVPVTSRPHKWELLAGSDHQARTQNVRPPWPVFPKTRDKRRPGPSEALEPTHLMRRNGFYQVALCHCPSWSKPPCGPLSEYLNPG